MKTCFFFTYSLKKLVVNTKDKNLLLTKPEHPKSETETVCPSKLKIHKMKNNCTLNKELNILNTSVVQENRRIMFFV